MYCDKGFQADGTVDVTGAKIGTLADEAESWPQALDLDGLTYGDLTDMPVRQRLDWLSRSASYSPQPYEELAAHYRRLGHDDEARRVLLAKQRQRRQQLPWWKRCWGWLQDGLAGYGYAPGRALLILAGAFIAGWLVFRARRPVPVVRARTDFQCRLVYPRCANPGACPRAGRDFDPQGATLGRAAGSISLAGCSLSQLSDHPLLQQDLETSAAGTCSRSPWCAALGVAGVLGWRPIQELVRSRRQGSRMT